MLCYFDGSNVILKLYSQTGSNEISYRSTGNAIHVISTDYDNNMIRCKFSRALEVSGDDANYMTDLTSGSAYNIYQFGSFDGGQGFITNSQVNVGAFSTTVRYLFTFNLKNHFIKVTRLYYREKTFFF